MPELATATAIEAPVLDTPEITEPTTPEVSEPTSPETETPESTEPVTADKSDGRSFAGKLRDLHKKLMASQDPNDHGTAKVVKELFFNNKILIDAFPGGAPEAIKLKEAYEQLGTPEQIQAIREDAATLEGIDTKWQAADPRFIDELADLNVESFKKLMPVGLNKFAQVDPEGYQRVMSGILSSTLAQAKMGDQLYLISRELQRGDKDEALKLIGQIQQWMGELDKSAKAPITTPQDDPRNTEFEQRQAKLEEREAEIFNQSIASDVNPWMESQVNSALSKLTNGAKVDPERMEIFRDRVSRELAKMLPQNFKENWNRLYAQGDKEALVKFVKGQQGANVSKAVSKVHALLFPSNGAKKAPVTTPAQQPTAKPAEAGWVKITARPKPEQIARGRNQTTDEMIFSGKAILRDGRKVMWDRA